MSYFSKFVGKIGSFTQSLFGGDNSTGKAKRGSRNSTDIQDPTKDMSLLDSTLPLGDVASNATSAFNNESTPPTEDVTPTAASASNNAEDVNTVVSDTATVQSESSTPVSKQNLAAIENAGDEILDENEVEEQELSNKLEISNNLMNFSPLNFVSSSPKDESSLPSQEQQLNRIEISISESNDHLMKTFVDPVEEPMDVADTSVNSTDSYLTAASGVSMYDEPPLTARDSYATCDLDADQALLFLSQGLNQLSIESPSVVSRNKTFTRRGHQSGDFRKQTKSESILPSSSAACHANPDSSQYLGAGEDLNANLNRTFDGACESFVVDNTIVETPKIQVLPSTPQKKNDDELNSNVSLEAKSPNMNASTPNKQPPTPKSQKIDSAKKDSAGRNYTGQQTAVVAPMVNRSFESVNKQSPVTARSPMSTVATSSPAKTTSQPLASSMPVPQVASNDEVFAQPSTNIFMNATDFDYLQQRPAVAVSGVGSASDTNLCRQSLYVKFDPLVAASTQHVATAAAAPPIDAESIADRRASIDARKMSDTSLNIQSTSWMDTAVSTEDITTSTDDESNLISVKTTPKSAVPKKDSSDASLVCPPTVVLKKKPPPMSYSSNDLIVDDSVDSPPAQRRHDFDEDSIFSPFECEFLDFTTNESETVDNIVRKCQTYIVAKEKEWLKKFREEREKSDKLSKENKDIKLNLEEYHRTMEEFISKVNELETNKQRFGDYDQILKEKERAVEDLRTVENALSELHRRYESLRSNVEEHKKNEEKWKELLASYENQVQVSEDMFRKLKQHAEEKLEAANAEIVRLRKAKDSDTVALKALCKKRDLQVASLEKTLEQKQREIQELSAICDELIQKVDNKNSKNNKKQF